MAASLSARDGSAKADADGSARPSESLIVTKFDEKGYAIRVGALYAVLLGDVVVNAFFEPPAPTLLSVLVLFIIQLVLLCASGVAAYFLITKTALFQAGLFGPLARRFRTLCVVLPVNLALFLAVRGIRVGRSLTYYPPLTIWSNGFQVLYIVHRLCYLAQYAALLHAAAQLRDPVHYVLSVAEVQRALARG